MQKRTQLRVASYNIRKAVGLDWRRDAERIVQVLHEIDADVVVLQESDKRVGQRSGVLPATRLQSDLGYVLVDLSIRPRSHGWHGNAILYRQGGLNLERSNRIHLPALEPRGAVAARFAEPGLEIIGVHLGLTRRIRARQLSALRAYMERADHPVLMAGDFNIWARGRQTGDLLGREAEMVLPGNSFHAARPTAPLDRFVLRGSIRQVSSHVHHSALAAKASDHLPVVIDAEVSHPCI